MAHNCPECCQLCHCGGDIDDCCLEGTKEEMGCTYCLDKEADLEDDNWIEPTDMGAQ